MISEEDVNLELCDDNIKKRLLSTLNNRIKLLNMFEPLFNKNYVKIDIDNMGIDINNEKEIIGFLENNQRYIEEQLRPIIGSWVIKNGSDWQKVRMFKTLRKE